MARKAHQAESAPYRMPEVFLGQVVLWHDAPGAPPTAPAVVTDVNTQSGTVALSAVVKSFGDVMPKDGVRHIDHPDQDAIRNTDQGCWSHTAFTEQVLARLKALEEIVTSAPPTTK